MPITYVPFYPGGWQDQPNTTTPIIAAALQNIENGMVLIYGTSQTIQYNATASGLVIPSGITLLRVIVSGNGGGGGGSAGSSPAQIGASGGGGGAGQWVEQIIAVSSGNTFAVTIPAFAAGGIAGTINQGAPGGDGTAGGDVIFNYNSGAIVITARGGGAGKGGALATSTGGNAGQYGGRTFLPSSLTQAIPGFGTPGGGSNTGAFPAGLGSGYGGGGGGGGGGANAGTADGGGGSAGGPAGTPGGTGGSAGGGTPQGGDAAANSSAGGGGAGGAKTVVTTGEVGARGGNGGTGFVIVQPIG